MNNTSIIQHKVSQVNTSFEIFTSNLEELLGLLRPELLDDLQADPASLVSMLENLGGEQELVLFNIIEHGELLSVQGKLAKAKQYHIGNPIITLMMTKKDIRCSLYVPFRILAYQNENMEVIVEYDLPSSLLAQFNNPTINEAANYLDEKLDILIKSADAIQLNPNINKDS